MIALPLIFAMAVFPNQGKSTVEQAMTWLPTDTETMVVAQGSGFTSPYIGKSSGPSIMAWPTGFSEGKLKGFTALTATSIIFGSRKFHYPDSIGVGWFEGAWIANLTDASLATAKEILAKTKFNSSALAGHSVLSCSEKANAAEIHHFYVVVIDHTLIVATNTNYLKALLERIATKPTDRSLPDSLEEWKFVDKTANFWAIRHINPATQLKNWGLDMGDKDTRGYGVSLAKNGDLRVVKLSDNPRGFEIAKTYWGSDELKPIVTKLTNSATEILIDKDPKQLGMGFFFLTIAMGYAIAI